MRSVPLLAAAVIISASAMACACGKSQPVSSTPARSSPASSTPAIPATCHGATPAPAGRPLTLHNSDNGKSFCLRTGGSVLVLLKGTPARKWRPIQASSAALAPAGNGRLTLELGVTGAYFKAVHPGVVRIYSSRPVCRPPGSGSSSAAASCGALLSYRVTVIITR